MRPKKTGEKKTDPISIKATPSLKVRVQEIADLHDRTLSQTALFLLERGLARYSVDGLLSEPETVPVFVVDAEIQEKTKVTLPQTQAANSPYKKSAGVKKRR